MSNKQQFHWKDNPGTIKVSPFQENLIGYGFGRFRVVGKYGRRKKTGSIWLVKCDCGDYEVRTTKAIKNPKNTEDKCAICRDIVYLNKHRN